MRLLRALLRRLARPFAWRKVGEAGVWGYAENRIDGRRAAYRTIAEGHSPLKRVWLGGGPWETPHLDPPSGGSPALPEETAYPSERVMEDAARRLGAPGARAFLAAAPPSMLCAFRLICSLIAKHEPPPGAPEVTE